MSFRRISVAMTRDWLTSMPFMPARMLIEFGQKMAKAAM
jgi:hypothetical protein